MSLNNLQLKALSKYMNFPLHDNIYFKDQLPEILKYNESYIINMDDSCVDNNLEKPSSGTHWTAFQINKKKSGIIEAIYFDPFGVGPSINVERIMKNHTNQKKILFTKKNIQSCLNSACGWFCASFLHNLNGNIHRTKEFYLDVSIYLDCFEDLNISQNFKKNEYVLKLFFQSSDKSKRQAIDVDYIVNNDDEADLTKIPVILETL